MFPGGFGLPFSAATLARRVVVVVVMARFLNCAKLEPVLHTTIIVLLLLKHSTTYGSTMYFHATSTNIPGIRSIVVPPIHGKIKREVDGMDADFSFASGVVSRWTSDHAPPPSGGRNIYMQCSCRRNLLSAKERCLKLNVFLSQN